MPGKIDPIRYFATWAPGRWVGVSCRAARGLVQRSALKVLAASAGEFSWSFHREQHILATLDHPNITRMLDIGLMKKVNLTW